MGWRDFLNPSLVEKVEKAEFTLTEPEHFPHIPQIPHGWESENQLTDAGWEVYHEYIEEMLCPKHGPTLTLEAAQSLAMELVSCVPGNLRKRNISGGWE